MAKYIVHYSRWSEVVLARHWRMFMFALLWALSYVNVRLQFVRTTLSNATAEAVFIRNTAVMENASAETALTSTTAPLQLQRQPQRQLPLPLKVNSRLLRQRKWARALLLLQHVTTATDLRLRVSVST